MKHAPASDAAPLSGLLEALRDAIHRGRRQALRAVDVAQVSTCWEIGRHIVEFEQGGASRATYGQKLLPRLAEALSREFGKGFDVSNLRHMRGFFLSFPIRDALRRELSWTHYRMLLRVGDPQARRWYMTEAASQNWSSRVLDRQIDTLYYERRLLGSDPVVSTSESVPPTRGPAPKPRDFLRDPVMLEFLGLPGSGRLLESSLEQALMDKLQSFLLELGKGFAFVARQQRVSTDFQDFYIDLVFYYYLLKCFVLIDLKAGRLTHQDIGQMDMYVRMYDELRRGPADNPTVGILLCDQKDLSVARYSILKGSEQIFASQYRLVLPSEDELREAIEQERAAWEEIEPLARKSFPRET
ncbi:PDDEXK nuclease domain-containing protein [Curvibacter lanceolatus]|uniref:PDDEXK nuclease domain-containing protein n=1 Tax=Curvibacter lanceolatus TaxID=86182 RepID=UPI000374ECD4|nr:PDDEXK nuclease domain-containing protein [Curvibacter lanceolatus]